MEGEVKLIITEVSEDSTASVPITATSIAAGFPSPADDYMDAPMDLNRYVVRNHASTFYARVKGLSMVDDGIDEGDLIVIDKSLEPTDNCLAVCYIDGDFTLKRFKREGAHGWLIPANKAFSPIKVSKENDFLIWGIVTYIIKKV